MCYLFFNGVVESILITGVFCVVFSAPLQPAPIVLSPEEAHKLTFAV